MKTFEIEVRQTVKVTLDETKFTPDFMAEFRASFYPFYEVEEHAEHIAQLAAREVYYFGSDRAEFVEGYGQIGDLGIRAEVTDSDTEVISLTIPS